MTTDVHRIVARKGEAVLVSAQLGDLPPNHLRVRTRFSAISAGTELSMLERSGQSDIDVPLGYQLSGVVEGVGTGLETTYTVGDPVVCYGGPYVHHASQVHVPKHLVAKLPATVALRDAALGGIGTIALHAFREGNLGLGETAAVVGLGALGNLIAQIADAAGCRVVAMEPNSNRRELAAACGIHPVSSAGELASKLRDHTDGHYADAVFMAVGGCSDGLLLDCLKVVRRRGRLVIVGTTQAQIPREELFQREVTLSVSRAGGPGRYDVSYETGILDYPYEHVRWTEHRNLQEVIRLLSLGRLRVSPLITGLFSPRHAAEAYNSLRQPGGGQLSVLFDWSAI